MDTTSLHRINIDFETYSDIDLTKVGQHRYAQDWSTDIICMSYAFDNEEPEEEAQIEL